MVNGVAKDVEMYNIDGRNYFKLRDIAYMLNGTGSQFNVDYDSANKTMVIEKGKAYTTTNGTEMQVGKDNSATTRRSTQALKVDDEMISGLTVYNIGGVNFFQLRELGDLVGFEVGYVPETKTATVTSK
jgi:hypothetical protein